MTGPQTPGSAESPPAAGPGPRVPASARGAAAGAGDPANEAPVRGQGYGEGPALAPAFDPYAALAAADDRRDRSSTGPGPSSFFAPECQVARQFAGHPAVNDRADKLAAMLGTAVHAALEAAYAGRGRHEVEVSYAGITGHADFLPDDEPDVVVDWKTTKVGKIVSIKRDGVPVGHRAQTSFYARAVDRPRVRLVYIPKDGGRRDIHVAELDRDDALVDEAVSLYYGLRARVARGDLPGPQRPADSWCRRYCEFYAAGTSGGREGCPGLPRQSVPPPPDGGLFHAPASASERTPV